MEHSALHALLLTGLIAALGGALAVRWLYLPAARALSSNDPLVREMIASASRWVAIGALAAALATVLDLFVQVAEVEGRTVFGGVEWRLVLRFATQTVVGQFSLARTGLLLLTAAAVGLRSKDKWPLVTAVAFGAVVATSFVSHAAAQPDHRAAAIACQIAHITAAAGWIGVLLHLFAARAQMLTEPTLQRVAFVAEVVRRFSPIAIATTSLLMFTGLLGAFRFLQDVGALFTSAYGLTLLVKLALIVPAVAAGFVNYHFIRPALLQITTDEEAQATSALRRFARMLELEVTAGVLVITVAGVLGSVSPPGIDGSQRLTAPQVRALLSPHLPTSHVDDWFAQEDPRGPTLDDLRYSEFTHNWSGVLVCGLGLGWLAQAVGERFGKCAGRVCPFLLLPFGIFIAVAANPELWLRQVSPWEAVTNPQILEHQLGALMIFLLAWLSWRDLRSPKHLQPLGHALPVIMIAGSLLLLGHAHSTLTVPDELTNLINVQHAVFGACGLFGGAVRWLVLRDVLQSRLANLLWPGGVIALGLFMAFFYREIV